MNRIRDRVGLTRTPNAGVRVLGVLLVLAMLISLPARLAWAQGDPGLSLDKEIFGGISVVESGEPFTYLLFYTCSGITQNCLDAEIADVIPAELEVIDVVATSHVDSVDIDGGTNTVTFDMVEPLPAGSTGVLRINVRFPPGTIPDGNPVTNTADFTASNAPSVTSNPVDVTVEGSFEKVAQKTGPATIVVGFPSTFDVSICDPDPFGGIPIASPILTDTLPADAVFVGAEGTEGVDWLYDAFGHTVTFINLPDSGVGGGCLTRQVTLRWDSEPAGLQTNTLDAGGTPSGCEAAPLPAHCNGVEGPIGLSPVGIDFPVIPPFAEMSPDKTSDSPSTFVEDNPDSADSGDYGTEILAGEVVTYNVSLANTGFITLTNVSVFDEIPTEVVLDDWSFGPPTGSPDVPPTVDAYYERSDAPGTWQFVGSFTSATTVSVASLGLPPGVVVTDLRWDIGSLSPLTGAWSSTINATSLITLTPGTVFTNCADFSAEYVEDGTPDTFALQACSDVEIVDVRAIPRVRKTNATGPFLPNTPVDFEVVLYNAVEAHLPVSNPVLADLLPPELVLVTPTLSYDGGPVGSPAPNLEFIDNFDGTGQTLIRASWNDQSGSGGTDARYGLQPGEAFTISFQAVILDGTPPDRYFNKAAIVDWDGPSDAATFLCNGSMVYIDSADLDEDLDTSEEGCQNSNAEGFVDVGIFLQMDSEKFVRGELDADFNKLGLTVQGGDVDYRLVITNTSNITVSEISVIDILPFIGDTGVIVPQARQSDWRPNMQGAVTDTQGISITTFYSTSANPCRPEVVASGPPGCEDPMWSMDIPADPTSVQSLRFLFCDADVDGNPTSCLELPQDASVTFEWPMVAPNDAPGHPSCLADPFEVAANPDCEIAWNSFAFTASGGGLQLRPAEPLRVGIRVVEDDLDIRNIGNFVWLDNAGQQDDGIQQPEEIGINGVRVELWDPGLDGLPNTADDVPVDYDGDGEDDFRFTGPDHFGNPGYYLFPDVPAGDYYVRFYPPDGYIVSPADAPPDDALDSDGVGSGTGPNGDFEYTDVFTLPVGPGNNLTIDQGLWLLMDYGDAPDTYPVEAASQPTPADAGRHFIVPGVTMGAVVDDETDGQPSADGFGDDQGSAGDDEDGVTFDQFLGTAAEPTGVLVIGALSTITIVATVDITSTLPVTGFLSAWIDWDGSGTWEPGEQIAFDEELLNGTVDGTIALTVNVPPGATTGTTFARFRWSTEPGLLPTGTAQDGEVEDYQVQLVNDPLKSIVETSEDHTTEVGPAPVDLAIGEIVRYRLEVSLPEAIVPSVRITDNLPAGLLYLDNGSATIEIIADGSLGAAPAPIAAIGGPFTDGVDPVFDVGTLNNDDLDADEERLIIEFDALVLNVASNQAGVDRTNNFDVSWAFFEGASNDVLVNLVEPAVDLAKSATTAPLDAGDTVVFEIVASQPGSADSTTAFELRITDTLSADLDLVAVGVIVPAYATATDNSVIASNDVDIAIDELRFGDSATVVVTATVLAAVESGLTIPNDAYLRFTSLPGTGTDPNDTGSTTPGASGDLDGERNGDDGPAGSPNDHAVVASASVELLAPSVDKLAPSPSSATIGALVTWTIAVSLPEGTTSSLVVSDVLPAGLIAVGTSVVTAAADSGGLLAADYSGTLPVPTTDTAAGDGNDVEWDFGDVVTPADNDGTNNRFLLRVVSRVENVIGNQNGVPLFNAARLGYEDPDAPGVLTEVPDPTPESMTVVEPVLAVSKTIPTPPVPSDAGSTVIYQVVIEHAGGSASDAFDAVFTDTIPAALTGASIDSVTASPIAAPSAEISGGTLRVPTAADGTFDLPQGAVVTVTFRADVAAGVAPYQVITNTGVVTWTTLDGVDPNERTAGDGPLDGGGLNDYETDDSAGFAIDPPSIAKALETTSAGHTTGSDVTIGEVVTYTVAITLPEGITPSMTITDDLPAGMAYVAGSASADLSGFNGTLTGGDPVVSTTGSGGDGDDLVLSFGPITVVGDNDPSNNGFLLRYAAVVLNVPGNVGLPPSRTDLDNLASVQIGANPPVTAGETVTVAEPRMVIAKDIDKDAAWPNDTVRITLTVSNTGTSDAFDVTIQDPISTTTFSALTPVTTPAGFSYGTAVSGPNTIVSYTGGSIPAGAARSFVFDLTLDGSLPPSPPDLLNEATVTQATTLDSTANDGDDTQEREAPDVSGDDTLTIIVPEIEMTKTSARETVVPGQLVTYTLTITNNGTAPAAGVTVTDTIPINTTFDLVNSTPVWTLPGGGPPCPPGLPGGLSCELDLTPLLPGGELAANGGTIDVVFAVLVNPVLPPGTTSITNTAIAADDGSRGIDPVPGNNDGQHADPVLTDWSDNPDSYATTAGAGGAFHYIDGLTFLGLLVDAEADGLPTNSALGDDLDGALDDEDGVLFSSPILAGQPATITVVAALGGFLNAWIDFDGNGAFDPGEQVAADLALAPGPNAVTLTAPGAITDTLYTRFRLTSYDTGGALGPTGPASDGEVEDYVLMALGNRVWLDNGLGGGLGNNGIQDGAELGIENAVVELYGLAQVPGVDTPIATTTTDASGDYLFTGLAPGNYVVHLPASNFDPAAPLEGLLSSQGAGVPNDDLDEDVDENGIDSPIPATTGISTAPVSLALGLEPTGEDGNPNTNLTIDLGLVEFDWGDLPEVPYPTSSTLNGARHIVDGVTFLGAGVDAEPDGAPTVNADGDDTAAPFDDEDGVSFLTPIMPGAVYTISVVASADSFLNAWIDFDANGVMSPFEQIAADTALTAGANLLTGTAPISTTGSLYSRFRVTADAGDATTPTGAANSGEVEDYVLLALGNRIFLDDSSGGATADDGAQGGAEPGIENVVVELYTSAQTPGVDAPIATTTTDVNGDYLFTGLTPDGYVVFVPQANFAPAGPLAGMLSSTGAGAPDSDLDQDVDEHGIDDPDPAANGIATAPITLSVGDEPNGNGSVNLTLDLGFVAFDLGDLPDLYGTTIGAGGASHIIDGTFLGAAVDADSDGQPTNAANGDDGAGTDDEDGVTFLSPLTPGQAATITIQAGTPGFLNGFIDFDGDGTLDPVTVVSASAGAVVPGSGLLADVELTSSGLYTLTIDVPAGISPASVYSRFRYTAAAGQATSPVGPAPTGEVEDYVLGSLGSRVFLDDGTGGATVADGAQTGGEAGVPGVVVELLDAGGAVIATTTTDGLGDYFFGGLPTGDYRVRIPAGEFLSGEPLYGLASSPGAGDPNADIDQDTDENGIDSIDPPSTGLVSGTINLVPGSAPTSEDGDANSNLTIDFGVARRDLGDLPDIYGTTDSVNGASHVIDDATFLGAGVDSESDGQPSAAANADDSAASDDEDGIQLLDPLVPGSTARIKVTASTAGFLSGFLDFDNDGTLDSVGVTAVSAGAILPGSGLLEDLQITGGGMVTITIAVPAVVSTTVYSRFRFAADTGQANTPTGDADSGEVEDYLFGALGNRVFLDDGLGGGVIADGAQNGTEAGIPGVTVELYTAGQTPGVDTPFGTTTTDGNGDYVFLGLMDGDYILHLPAGNFASGQPLFELFSTPGAGDPEAGIDQDVDENGLDELDPATTGISTATVNLTVGAETAAEDGDPNSDLTIDFALVEGVTIGNYVWEDLNGNGEQDEPPSSGVNGVRVILIDATTGLPVDDPANPGNPLTAVTMDDSFGNPGYYLFAGLGQGDYAVRFDLVTLPPGYVPTTQDAGGVGDDVDSDADPTTGLTANTGPLLNGELDLTLDMGIVRPVLVSGTLWHDADRDDVIDGAEPGLGGIVVTIFRDDDGVPGPSPGDTPVDIAVTDAFGNYVFDNLPPGSYYIDVDDATVPPGMAPTAPGNDPSPVVTLGPGESATDLDVGYSSDDPTRGILGDTVWYDADGDGIHDPGEPGIEGVRVVVSGPGGAFQTFTGPDGSWYVPNLIPGSYAVAVDTSTLPPGYNSTPTNGAPVRTLLLPAGVDVLYGDFGFTSVAGTTASIGDTVFLDANGDGVQDAGEPGIAGVSINLLDGTTGDLIGTTITGPDGSYDFVGLPAGDYDVVVTDVDDVLGTLGLTTPLAPTTGIVVAGGDDYDGADFGYGNPGGVAGVGAAGLIGTTIWHDLDGDGVRDPEESGIGGVAVDLWRDVDGDGALSPGTDMLLSSTTTNGLGEYIFNNLPFDDYLVVVDEGSPSLTGMSRTAGAPFTNDNSQTTPYPTTLTPGDPADLRADFGYVANVGYPIFGVIFIDLDNDGIYDEGAETVIPRIPVSLYRDDNGNGVLDPGEPKVGMTETGEDPPDNGTYVFPNMPDGNYIVVVEAEGTRLEGYFQTTQTGTGSTEPAEVDGDLSPNHNFGFLAPGGSRTNPVTIATFGSERSADGGARITWTTASEAGNAGFDVYVETADGIRRVNEQLVPTASSDAFGPQEYVLDVPAETLGNAATLWIEDVDLRGEARRHGPFELGTNTGDTLDMRPIDWPTIATEHAELGVERTTATADEAAARLDALRTEFAAEGLDLDGAQTDGADGMFDAQLAERFVDALTRADASGALADLHIEQTGLVQVTHADLAAAGVDLTGLPTALLAVTVDGRAVSRDVAGGATWSADSALVFHARTRDSVYGETNVYRIGLDWDAATRIAQADGTPSADAVPPAWYLETVSMNRDHGYAPGAPGADPWYDAQMMARGGPEEQTFPIRLDELVVTDEAPSVLRMDVWGVTDWPAGATPDHHVELILNEVVVADTRFDGVVEERMTVSLEPGMLREGGNAVTVSLPGDTGQRYDMVAVDRYAVTYPRSFTARDGALTFTASGDVFEVTGLQTDDVVVLRHRHGDVVELTGAELRAGDEAGTFTARFAGLADAATYTVAERSTLAAPASITASRRVTQAQLLADAADYVAIAHGSFVDGLDELVAAREAEGLTVKVVDVADVYGAYGHGQFGAEPIRAYVAAAHEQLGTQYVLLVGGDTYDYRDRLALGSMSFVPSPYAATGDLIRHAPVDPLYGDVDGDGAPEVAVGRFPVRTTVELANVVAKTLAYGRKDYGRTAVFAADAVDRGVSYAQEAEGFAAELPGDWTVARAYLDEEGGVASARATLLRSIEEGVALVSYAGHSQADAWGFQGLFDGGDAAALNNAGRPTVVSQWGCWNTYHVAPRYDTMGHQLLLSDDRGAAAVLGSATLSDSDSDSRLGELVTPRMTEQGMTLGAAVVSAKRDLAISHPDDLDVILGWTLLGDPALLIEPTR